jgi:hypothetical protein
MTSDNLHGMTSTVEKYSIDTTGERLETVIKYHESRTILNSKTTKIGDKST